MEVQDCASSSTDPLGRWHLGFETWQTADSKYEELHSVAPLRTPTRLRRLQYTGYTDHFIRHSTVSAAMAQEGLSLDWYRSYNLSWHNPSQYFDSLDTLQGESGNLKNCDDPQYPVAHLESYRRHFGEDTDGYRIVNGRASIVCHYGGRWWLSPACRREPQTCIPVIDAGHGWGSQLIFQQATQHGIPVAVANAKTQEEWCRLGRQYNVITYWWGPDVTFLRESLAPVVFPQHSASEYAMGLRVTGATLQSLHSWAARGLGDIAAPVQKLASAVDLTRENIMDLLERVLDGQSYYEAACSWLRRETATWEAWLPDPSVCDIKGQGLVQSSSNDAACKWCGPGTASTLTLATRVCTACTVGTYQPHTRAIECVECEPGRYTSTNGSDICKECDLGHYISFGGASACTPCPAGATTSRVGASSASACHECQPGKVLVGQTCQDCPDGRFADKPGLTQCMQCPIGRTTGDGNDHEECDPMWEYRVAVMLAFGTLSASLIIVSLTVRRRLLISDISQKDGKIVITTLNDHWVVKHRGRLGATLSDTQCPELHGSCTIRRLSRLTLELDSPRYSGVQADGMSIGILTLDFPGELRYTGLDYLPVAILAPVLAAVSIATMLTMPLVLIDCIAISSAGAATGLLALASRWWRKNSLVKKVPKNCALQAFKRELAEKNPDPQLVESGPQRAVSTGQVWKLWEFFSSFIRERNMYYVVQEVIIPITEEKHLSYAEVAGCTDLQYFVSHSWGDPFAEFALSLRSHAQDVAGANWQDVRFWACSFSINQWRVKEELGGHWSETSFFRSLRSETCQGTVLVIQESASPLTRSWCLFELLQTYLLRRDRPGSFCGLVLATNAGVLNNGTAPIDLVLSIARKIIGLFCEEAQATDPEDKAMIDRAILKEVGSFEAMNQFVRRQIQDAVMAGKSKVEENIQLVVRNLQDINRRDKEESMKRESKESIRTHSSSATHDLTRTSRRPPIPLPLPWLDGDDSMDTLDSSKPPKVSL